MENNNTKICLMVIYNHRYDKNIPRIEELYKGKFSHIFHIMPFYDGNKENVIPVYENSFYFSNYIAQAYQHLKNKGFTHFFVVADDMILNPVINENSLWDETGIQKDECYISGFLEMHKRKQWWGHIISAMKFKLKQPGVEFQSYLPKIEEAEKCFKKFNLEYKAIPWKLLLFSTNLKTKLKLIKRGKILRKFKYPLVGGYSDIFLITAKTMEKFAQYCGIFAASRLFVEIAIPTSMVLSAEKIHVGSGKLKGSAMWSNDVKKSLAEKYQNSLSALLKDYPKDTFFLHPVKLSAWK